MTKKSSGIPDEMLQLLAAADKKQGFPVGTMASVMQQESGGQAKFLNDPSAYHYAAGPDGRRVAKHTGKVSTAFGPFGILESTGRDPGYGVAPLKDKTIAEQVRFASDYLAARSKSSGGLQNGLAGYGEGAKYAQQVVARLGGSTKGIKKTAPVPAARDEVTAIPEQVVAAQDLPPMEVEPAAAQFNTAPAPNPVVAQADPVAPLWKEFQDAMAAREVEAQPNQGVNSLASYGMTAPIQMAQPTQASIMADIGRYGVNREVNFGPFTGFMGGFHA